MRFDTIIIGGGLSSLVCGIKLSRAGQSCLIVSAGMNALHFSSGSFGLLSRMPDGTPVQEPLKAIAGLPAGHPYSKIGAVKAAEYAECVKPFFKECGILLRGNECGRNQYKFTPTGSFKPSWLALEDTPLFDSVDAAIGGKALVVNFAGFLDFNTRFVAEGLERRGATCRIEAIHHPEIERIRVNPAEMRSVNIARIMNKEDNWKQFVHQVREIMDGESVVVLPEVFGLFNPSIVQWIREMIPAEVMFVGTMPPSVPGLRVQRQLKKAFEDAGGTFLQGDEAIDPVIEDGRVSSIRTVNLGTTRLEADNFVLASGSYFGKGIQTTPGKVYEPVFGLDVDYPEDRTSWYAQDFAAKQEYLGFGVTTDNSFKAYLGGSIIGNLYVIGAELGGCNPLAEGSGAGVAILSAFSAADSILG